jgi:hypothetical protein
MRFACRQNVAPPIPSLWLNKRRKWPISEGALERNICHVTYIGEQNQFGS